MVIVAYSRIYRTVHSIFDSQGSHILRIPLKINQISLGTTSVFRSARFIFLTQIFGATFYARVKTFEVTTILYARTNSFLDSTKQLTRVDFPTAC